jgi:hypothetical protein
MRRLQNKLTYANVVATLALIIAIGGASAFAASQLGKNSVGAKQLKPNAVTTAKIKNEAVVGVKVKKGTLTGTQVNASTLGTVPNATHAATSDSASVAKVASSLPSPELWHSVGATGEPAFQHSCNDAGLPDSPNVRFYKDQLEIVHLEGAYNSCAAVGAIAFQLPAGFRPRPTLNFPLPLFGEQGVIAVHGGAPIIPATEAGGVDCPVLLCVLDGISFRAES